MDPHALSPLAPDQDRPFVVGIGGSAGSVPALQSFFEAVPDTSGLSFVVVTHLAPDHESHLAEVLQARTSLPVTQVTDPTELDANHVYVTPPGKTLVMEETTLVPHALDAPEERRSPIDCFFRSLAQAPVHPLGVVLSGSGTDGSVGLRAITEAGGMVAVQDPSEAEHSSMPRSAIETSLVDFVLPVAELARQLAEQRHVARELQVPTDPADLDEEEQTVLSQIFDQVRNRTGHDFSDYKRSTMLRRIHRRLHVHHISSFEEYLAYLKEHPSEASALQKDFLISVTNFFRDPEAFAALRDQAMPAIFEGKGVDDPVRVWVAGCATGEEAYSVAMVLMEQAAHTSLSADHIQVFATDIDEEALATARRGRYPEPIESDVPSDYLDRFFQREGNEYVVRDAVRERVLFTPHSLLKDPPFSNLDLILCRNLLIYLRRDLQASVFDLFSYALNDGGYLLLGSSESADVSDGVFGTVDQAHRLYRRRSGKRSVPELPSGPLSPSTPDAGEAAPFARQKPSKAALHQRLLEAYAPPSAIVDEEYTFVHLSQTAGRYLQHPMGPPNTNIVDVVRPELRASLRSALREVFEDNGTVRTQPVTVRFEDRERSVQLVVRTAQEVPEADGLALVVFMEADESVPISPEPAPAEDERVQRLEAELRQTKQELQATVEEHETSKQEMRAANEELRSMNEEYKSMTEELETSKEELQSVNEELKTVNQELENKVEALRQANSDLKNLMAATDIGTLFLDRDLNIQRYMPRIEDLFNIHSSDEGRAIGDFTHRLDYDRLEADAQQVLDDLTPVEREAWSEAGECFLVRHHPYRTVEDKIDGVVVTFVDITRRKKVEEELRAANASLQERTEQVQSLSEALTSAEETERKRLSEVLHDTLQQLLFAAKMKLDQLAEHVALGEEKTDLLERSVELIDEGIETTRTLSKELDPPVGNQSIRDAFEWLCFHMEDAYGLTVHLKARGHFKTTDKTLRILLFRLVRELLFNVVKHAEVEMADLWLLEGEGRLRVVVQDEGQGFDPAAHDVESGGVGLVSARDRIELIGGTFSLDATPREGTRVVIEVPWRAEGMGAAP